jgi:hypothetical protein
VCVCACARVLARTRAAPARGLAAGSRRLNGPGGGGGRPGGGRRPQQQPRILQRAHLRRRPVTAAAATGGYGGPAAGQAARHRAGPGSRPYYDDDPDSPAGIPRRLPLGLREARETIIRGLGPGLGPGLAAGFQLAR